MDFKAQNTTIESALSKVEDCLLINGYFNDSLTIPIISYVTESQIENKKKGKKLSFLVAESFQNIVRHGHDENELNKSLKLKRGFFAMCKVQSEITICSTNAIANEKVSKLESDLKHLAGLDNESLKSEFIEVLSQNKTTEGGGAGLGLIEIMRKTGSKFTYSFSKKDEGLSYINFDILFNENNRVEKQIYELDSNLLRTISSNESITFLRKGLFNHDNFIQLSSVLEKKANNDSQPESNTFIYIFIELIQNIYKHGFKNENGDVPGLFYIRTFSDQIIFTSKNVSTIHNAERAKERIDELKNLSSKELLTLYKERITQTFNFEDKSSADIGLIEIIKETKNPILCEIENISEQKCHITFTAKISL
jgi:hypothetical protein